MVDEVVKMTDLRKYFVAFANCCYQNPTSICPQHQMILPRIIKGSPAHRPKAAKEGGSSPTFFIVKATSRIRVTTRIQTPCTSGPVLDFFDT